MAISQTPQTRLIAAISLGLVIAAIATYQIIVYYNSTGSAGNSIASLSYITSLLPKLPTAVTNAVHLVVTIVTLLIYDSLQKLQNINVLDLFTNHIGQNSLQRVGSYILVLVICVVCVSTWGFHPTHMHMDLSTNPNNPSAKRLIQDKSSSSPGKKSYVASLFASNDDGIDAY
ncbi:hypothetical protein EON65_47585, partial [archaeon]